MTTTPQQAPQYDQAAMARAQHQYENESKSMGVTFVLWLFFGAFGGHRFYMGYTGVGVAMLLTLGGIGVWALIDGFFIPSRVRATNERIRVDVYRRNGLPTH